MAGRGGVLPLMRRVPSMSPAHLIITGTLLVLLAILFWRYGLLMFSPGRLSAASSEGSTASGFQSHADFERVCERCHRPFRTDHDDLCVACHTDIGQQLALARGLHSEMPEVRACAACHPEHRGQDFDARAAALASFDHRRTEFSLIRHQINYDATLTACSTCHGPEMDASPETACASCHSEADPAFVTQHTSDFGPACLDCHDGIDRMVGFDHSTTGYVLTDGHAQTACAGCHGSRAFSDTPDTCASCHPEPAIHAGSLGTDCELCHTTAGWSPARLAGASFSHAEVTDFALDGHQSGSGGPLVPCASCHPAGLEYFNTKACVDCHEERDPAYTRDHSDRFGMACASCHDGSGGARDFDHARVLALEQRHAEIACSACHVQATTQPLSAECVACHEEPPVHAGDFGTNCQYCHDASGWSGAQLRIHVFPLDHASEGDLACETCHTTNYTAYTCDGCHEHEAESTRPDHVATGLSAADLPECASCHPSGMAAGSGR